jgi:BirA family biotin operon repressor/biotin-[acetyl-CoA-carboxylase] ligase
LIENKKAAGVLAEAAWQGNELHGVILGIGVNLLAPSVPPPGDLIFPATCIKAHTRIEIKPLEFLTFLVDALIRNRKELITRDFIRRYEQHLAYKGQTITIDTGKGEKYYGLLRGVDDDGRIIIIHENGDLLTFPIGDVRLRST